MIRCAPKTSVSIALLAVLLIGYGIVLVMLGYLMQGIASIFLYVGTLVFLVICLLLTVKLLASYKRLSIDKKEVIIRYLFRTYRFSISELTAWEEIVIKTFGKQEFRQLVLVFGQVQVGISQQEYTGYEPLRQYLQKNVSAFKRISK